MAVTLDLDPARRRLAGLPEVDVARMALERLGRLQAEMAERDIGGMLLYDPVNVRYATGTRNMQVWAMHNSSRYCLVPAEGGAVVFDFVHCEHLSEHLPTVAESRPAKMWIFHISGSRRQEVMAAWAAELADEVVQCCGNRRLAVDRLDGDPRRALESHGIEVSFGQDLVEYARRIKTADEQVAQRHAAVICTSALAVAMGFLSPAGMRSGFKVIRQMHYQSDRRHPGDLCGFLPLRGAASERVAQYGGGSGMPIPRKPSIRASRSPFSATWARSLSNSVRSSVRSSLWAAASSVRSSVRSSLWAAVNSALSVSILCCWFQMMANTPNTTATSWATGMSWGNRGAAARARSSPGASAAVRGPACGTGRSSGAARVSGLAIHLPYIPHHAVQHDIMRCMS